MWLLPSRKVSTAEVETSNATETLNRLEEIVQDV
jgi:hypothetical protein